MLFHRSAFFQNATQKNRRATETRHVLELVDGILRLLQDRGISRFMTPKQKHFGIRDQLGALLMRFMSQPNGLLQIAVKFISGAELDASNANLDANLLL